MVCENAPAGEKYLLWIEKIPDFKKIPVRFAIAGIPGTNGLDAYRRVKGDAQ
jgi:hypothetical protein